MKAGVDYIGLGLGVFIQNNKGEVLLMKRGPLAKNEAGFWMLPGGSVEFGETIKDAALREIKEELDLEIEITNQMPAYDHILVEEGQHWVTNIFSARIVSGEPKIMEPGKCDEIAWFSLENLPSPIAKASQKALDYFKNGN